MKFTRKTIKKRRIIIEQKFYICKHCGNIIAKVKDAGVPVICCSEPMSEIVPGTTDAARIRRLDEHAQIIMIERRGYVSYANCVLPYYVGGVIHFTKKDVAELLANATSYPEEIYSRVEKILSAQMRKYAYLFP